VTCLKSPDRLPHRNSHVTKLTPSPLCTRQLQRGPTDDRTSNESINGTAPSNCCAGTREILDGTCNASQRMLTRAGPCVEPLMIPPCGKM